MEPPNGASLRQRVHDHWPGDRGRWPCEQGRKACLDPSERASVRLFRSRVVVEDAYRGHGVVRRVDDVVGHEAFDVADNWNGTVLDPLSQLFGHAGLCLALTNGGVHGILLQQSVAQPRHCVSRTPTIGETWFGENVPERRCRRARPRPERQPATTKARSNRSPRRGLAYGAAPMRVASTNCSTASSTWRLVRPRGV